MMSLLLALAASAGGCSSGKGLIAKDSAPSVPLTQRLRVKPMFLKIPGEDQLAEGNNDYNEGFRDGCHTTIGIVGWGPYRFYGFDYNVNRGLENTKYYEGFRLGSAACAYYLDSDVF